MLTGIDSSPLPPPPLQFCVQDKWWLNKGMDKLDGRCQRTQRNLDQVSCNKYLD